MSASLPFASGGLRLDQAPPLSIPASFFLLAPVSVVAAGAWLILRGEVALSSPWHPAALVLSHLATLGLLCSVMLGALYQVVPVIAGAPVPAIRAAHAVWAMFSAGIVALLVGLGGGPRSFIVPGGAVLLLALLVFLLPVAWTLARRGARTPTVAGMGLALLSLATVLTLGLLQAWGHATFRFPGPRNWWVQVHLCAGLLGWVGALIASVSWQVVPMFYLAPDPGRREKLLTLVLLFLGVASPVAVLLAGPEPANASRLLALCAAPAAIAAWLMHPVATLLRISSRMRRRPDASLAFWRAGLATALLLGPLAAVAVATSDPRWPILLVWLAAWGWAGMIVHGMLGRIVSFLVWFHRYSQLVGVREVPSMRDLLPERHVRASLALHLGSLVLGAAAIVLQDGVLARATGILLVATGASLALALLRALARRPAAEAADDINRDAGQPGSG